ncbi:DUF1349 domain-containing protein [Cellulosimicrobium protaetiae]|uniref:DUF1349 domain-containing protein n=1 Tax=Cellulosimicrobium protaetiae TaxID=2587808 RepID=A0A6M5UFF6_9MICO|nr:DUF1349 domain-containing protein [Cellulosimicrobium protaetiae]QJW35943.1 DUF1349 domain-containing protein [Cellulosimicrobium protaetiae]
MRTRAAALRGRPGVVATAVAALTAVLAAGAVVPASAQTGAPPAVGASVPDAGLATAPVAARTAADDGPSASDLPMFEYRGVITDKESMIYNPTDEFIFPSVFHAGAYLDDPLGEWYLYYAPHDSPGGISLMYADSLEGPWTEYAHNPIVANEWLPFYERVSHVSSPDVLWDDEAGQVLLYFHGENSTTRWATSSDGVTFDDSGVAVTNADGGAGTTETSYARVVEHPDPSSGYRFAMTYMQNRTDNIRRIKVAESVDGKAWVVRPDPLVVPDAATGTNVSGGNLWVWEGQLYVVYHGSTGITFARTLDPTMTQVGPRWELHRASGAGADTGRVAAPEIVTDGDETYLFYESGDRLGATVAWAQRDPDAVRPPEPGQDPDPLREQCSGAASDEFDGTALDPALWSVVRGGTARHELADGALRVPTYPTGVAGASLPLQAVPSGPWEVTTAVSVSPTERFQQGGLLLYRDDANYAKLDLVHGSLGPRVEFIWRQNGTDRNTGFDSVVPPAGLGDTFWLRLTSDGSLVQASVSVDGVDFAPWGRTVDVGALGATGVGPFAMRGSATPPEIVASFDWFRWTPTAEEAAACEDDGPAVEVQTVTRCLAGRAYVAVTARNEGDGPATVRLVTPFGERTVADVATGRSAYQSFAARSTAVVAGTATVEVVRADGAGGSTSVAYDALTCG